MRTLVWFRGKDLRLADHAPLRDALKAGDVLPLFVLDPHFFSPARAAEHAHRLQFLLDALRELAAAIASRGSRLIVVSGRSVDVLPELARAWRADRVVAHRWVEPFGRERDRIIGERLERPFDLYEGETLLPPGTLRSGSGRPYAVFGAFARAFWKRFEIRRPLPTPRRLPALPRDVRAEETPIPTCAALGLAPNVALQEGGERAGRRRLRRFLRSAAHGYADARDRMDLAGTSRLSADLKFGTVSVRQVCFAVTRALGESQAARSYLNELVWRDFAHSSLWDRPSLLDKPFRAAFADFPWRRDDAGWLAWARGHTGYPLVDAAARQLLSEGFVHNRARMISASFLCKHLMIDFRRGEAHYLKHLTDGDWAQNTAGWQWSAGCGCDAQPYFRVFNPVAQGKKHDPEGDYVRRWVPELSRVPTRYVHRPWEAPAVVLERAGVRLGEDYPRPIVQHAFARARFLETARAHLARP